MTTGSYLLDCLIFLFIMLCAMSLYVSAITKKDSWRLWLAFGVAGLGVLFSLLIWLFR